MNEWKNLLAYFGGHFGFFSRIISTVICIRNNLLSIVNKYFRNSVLKNSIKLPFERKTLVLSLYLAAILNFEFPGVPHVHFEKGLGNMLNIYSITIKM